jgi:bla regulator protein BlaR1
MIDLSSVANHVWQSTACTAIAGLLALALRNNRAAVRYGLWMAASVKFLVPFSLLVSAGDQLGWIASPSIPQPQFAVVVEQVVSPIASAAPAPSGATNPSASHWILSALFAVWLCGVIAGLALWFRWWRRIRILQRTARPLKLSLPVPVMSSSARIEPGVFGIHKPVLLLPDGITDRLTSSQLDAVLAHELCHVRRRDNLTAAIHMAVEVIFWFHPLVWWLTARLIEERERACDEEVLATSSDPHVYAEGILNVCRFYLESPLACASGITGSDLKKRVDGILANRRALELDLGRRTLLAAAGALIVASPVVIGMLHAQPRSAQSPANAVYEVASIKPNQSGERPSLRVARGGRTTVTNNTLKRLLVFAYNVQDYQISGGPKWADSIGYDIEAKPEHPVDPGPDNINDFRKLVQALLADRFKLTLQHSSKELPIYALVVGNDGPKLTVREKPANPTDMRLTGGRGLIVGQQITLDHLAENLSARLGRTVRDQTSLTGYYDFRLEWTPDEPDGESVPDRTGPSIFTAIQEQLGLRLEARRGPVEILVIDHAEPPSAN